MSSSLIPEFRYEVRYLDVASGLEVLLSEPRRADNTFTASLPAGAEGEGNILHTFVYIFSSTGVAQRIPLDVIVQPLVLDDDDFPAFFDDVRRTMVQSLHVLDTTTANNAAQCFADSVTRGHTPRGNETFTRG